MTIHNKLVRDRIPDIVAQDGQRARVRRLRDEERLGALQAKLLEEATELFEAADDEAALEELADISEVVLALAKAHGATPAELEDVREHKARERGAFDEGWFLIEII